MYKLREYQSKAVDSAVTFFEGHRRTNGLIVLPTGAGKSLVIANIAYRLDAPVLVLQPSKEILEQNYDKYCSYDPMTAGIFSASFNRRELCKVTFATIGSVKNYTDHFRKYRYVIIDECHNVNADGGMYCDFIKATGCKVLGLTATPYRLYSARFYGSMLRFITRTRPRLFAEVLYQVQVRTLLEQGFLAQMNYYPMNVVDTRQLKLNSTGAEYTDNSIKKHFAQIKFDEQLQNIIQRLLIAKRTSILVFCKFVEEAQRLVDHFGSLAAVVSGDMGKVERESVLQRFKGGEIQVVANVGVLTTGFDFPALATVVLARPTMSLALYYQMCGRAIRPHGDKVSWIVDLCGNVKRFGRVEDLVLHESAPGLWAVYSGSRQLTNVFFKK